MKIAEFNVNNNTISFHNSYWGTEQVFLNNKEISKKYSWFGAKHRINIEKDSYTIKSNITIERNGLGISAGHF